MSTAKSSGVGEFLMKDQFKEKPTPIIPEQQNNIYCDSINETLKKCCGDITITMKVS